MSQLLKAEPENIDNARAAWVGIFGTLTVVALVFALESLYHRFAHFAFLEDHSGVVYAKSREIQSQQRQALKAYRWVDRDKGIVAIPLTKAMELVATEVRQEAQN